MASDLKTVGLSLKADGVVDFKKSLTEVNNAINENRSAFRLAKTEWDKSTSAAEKLRTQQEYLQSQTEAYTAKVERLNEILAAQESAEVRDEAAISKTKQQLDNAQATLNNYKSGLEDVNKKLESGAATLEDYSKKVQGFSDATGKVSKSLTKNVTAPVTAATAGIMASWAKVDEGMDIIVEKTGATGDALEEMQNSARNIAKSIPTDFATAGSAVGEVNTRFHLTGQELEDLATKFVEFATLNNTDVSTTVDNVQKVIEAFGLKAQDAGAVLDTMNKVGQDTGISMDSLATTMVSNAAALKELGMTAGDAATFLGQCEVSGVDTSTVMAGLKKALVNASGEGKSMKDALSELQTTLVNSQNSTEAYNAACDLFGNKAGPALAQFCQEGKLNFETLGASINDNVGSVQDTFNATLDPADQFKITLNQLQDAGFDVGNALGPVLAEALQTVTPILKDLINSWNSLSPETQEMIIKAVLLAATLGPVFSVISKIAGGVGTLLSIGAKVAPILSIVKTAFATLNAIMLANPIILIIAGIVALIAILVTAYNKCDWFREGVNKFCGDIKNFFLDAGENISNGIKKLIQGFKDAGTKIKDTATKAVTKLKSIFDFDWKLPKIKMPHFKASGEFSLSPLKTPKISVDWYAKGGILNKPTIFGMNGGNALGGGEAGPEAVLPIKLLKDYIREENQSNNATLVAMIAEAIQSLSLTAENNIYIGDKKTVTMIVELVLKRMSNKMIGEKGARGAYA